MFAQLMFETNNQPTHFPVPTPKPQLCLYTLFSCRLLRPPISKTKFLKSKVCSKNVQTLVY